MFVECRDNHFINESLIKMSTRQAGMDWDGHSWLCQSRDERDGHLKTLTEISTSVGRLLKLTEKVTTVYFSGSKMKKLCIWLSGGTATFQHFWIRLKQPQTTPQTK